MISKYSENRGYSDQTGTKWAGLAPERNELAPMSPDEGRLIRNNSRRSRRCPEVRNESTARRSEAKTSKIAVFRDIRSNECGVWRGFESSGTSWAVRTPASRAPVEGGVKHWEQ